MIKNINSGIMYFLGVRLPHASYGGAQHGKNTQTGDRKMLKQKPNRYLLAAAGLGISLAMAMPVHARYYSASDCAYRAERAAGNTYGAVGGAVTGAVGGATVGAIVSRNSRRGARKGAGIGAVVGGTSGAARRSTTYRRVYDDCMAGRLR